MTQYRPFSNNTEFCVWQEHNCLRCSRYECESSSEEEAGCISAFNLDLSLMGDGTIPDYCVNDIGYKDKYTEGENHFCDLCSRCKEFQPITNN